MENKKWQSKPEVKKGNIGEQIGQELLIKWGYIIYKVINDGPHIIDFFAHKGIEKDLICLDVKTKRRMALYPRTGFNYNNFIEYKNLQIKHNLRVFILFIDDFEGYAYGQWLDKLGEGFKKGSYETVIIWELAQMEIIRKLTEVEINELNKLTIERYDYSKVEKYF